MPPEAVRVADAPAQMAALEGVIMATGSGFTVIFVDVPEEQPAAFVTVTEYVPELETVIAAVVSFVLQRYETPPLAVRVADAPAQSIPSLLVVPEVSLTAIEAAGSAFTVILNVQVCAQLVYVMVCVPTPATAGLNMPPLTPAPL